MMNVSDETNLKNVFPLKLKRQVNHVELMKGGVNSRIYKVTDQSQQAYFAKFYLQLPHDNRNRLETEFQSLSFLWKRNNRHIPQPLFCEADLQLAVYDFVGGRHFKEHEITAKVMTEVIAFLTGLQELKKKKWPWHVPMASEACFSIDQYLENLTGRIKRLSELSQPALAALMTGPFKAVWEQVQSTMRQDAKELHWKLNKELSPILRVLSPSDVGFHNILRHPKNGSLIFIDFEYFGWDDPVKMMCDFVLQPEIPIPKSGRPAFLKNFLKAFSMDRELPIRFQLIYPMLALRWCCIILNAFFKNGQDDAFLNGQIQKASQKIEVLSQELSTKAYMQWIK